MRLLVLLLVTGCAGSFEETRPALVGSPPPSEHCISLDAQHRNWGGVSKFSGALSGGAGLATVPVPGEVPKLTLAVSSAVLAAAATGTHFLSEDAAESWARDCSR